MSGFAIIITLLVASMMLGPLLLMRPSRRQQHLSVLRSKALELGLKVQLRSYQNQTLAEYVKAWPLHDDSEFVPKAWALEEKNYSHEIHFLNKWDWEDDTSSDHVHYDLIKMILSQMPEGVNRLSANKLGVSCVWNEKGGIESLQKINENLSRLSQGLAPASAD